MNEYVSVVGRCLDFVTKKLSIVICFVVLLAMAKVTLVYSSKTPEFLQTPFAGVKILSLAGIVTMVLYYIRNRQRFWYGLAQVLTGGVFTFVLFKTIALRIAGGQILGTYEINLQNIYLLMPVVFLMVLVLGMVNIRHGWKEDFFLGKSIHAGLRRIFALEYGRNIGMLLFSFSTLPVYYAFYTSFQDDPVEILKRESHVREETNNNDHPRIRFYNQIHHILPADASYCGTSIEWAVKKAGWGLDVDYPPRASNWVQKEEYMIWSRECGVESGKVPRRNDVVVFYKEGNWHVGLLEDWQEGSPSCLTVEGNTTDENVAAIQNPVKKEGVYKGKIRSKDEIYCVVRPYFFPFY